MMRKHCRLCGSEIPWPYIPMTQNERIIFYFILNYTKPIRTSTDLALMTGFTAVNVRTILARLRRKLIKTEVRLTSCPYKIVREIKPKPGVNTQEGYPST